MDKPTIGRIVIFKDENSIDNAAIITRVWSETCININYFTDDGVKIFTSCVQGTSNHQWSWPQRAN